MCLGFFWYRFGVARLRWGSKSGNSLTRSGVIAQSAANAAMFEKFECMSEFMVLGGRANAVVVGIGGYSASFFLCLLVSFSCAGAVSVTILAPLRCNCVASRCFVDSWVDFSAKGEVILDTLVAPKLTKAAQNLPKTRPSTASKQKFSFRHHSRWPAVLPTQ